MIQTTLVPGVAWPRTVEIPKHRSVSRKTFYDLLRYVRDNPRCTSRDMTEHFGHTQTYIGHALAHLFRIGLVGRESVPGKSGGFVFVYSPL